MHGDFVDRRFKNLQKSITKKSGDVVLLVSGRKLLNHYFELESERSLNIEHYRK